MWHQQKWWSSIGNRKDTPLTWIEIELFDYINYDLQRKIESLISTYDVRKINFPKISGNKKVYIEEKYNTQVKYLADSEYVSL